MVAKFRFQHSSEPKQINQHLFSRKWVTGINQFTKIRPILEAKFGNNHNYKNNYIITIEYDKHNKQKSFSTSLT